MWRWRWRGGDGAPQEGISQLQSVPRLWKEIWSFAEGLLRQSCQFSKKHSFVRFELTNVFDPICARVRRVSAVGDRTQGLHAELSHQLLQQEGKGQLGFKFSRRE